MKVLHKNMKNIYHVVLKNTKGYVHINKEQKGTDKS